MKRTLTLKKDRLTELATDDLVLVVGAFPTPVLPHTIILTLCATTG